MIIIEVRVLVTVAVHLVMKIMNMTVIRDCHIQNPIGWCEIILPKSENFRLLAADHFITTFSRNFRLLGEKTFKTTSSIITKVYYFQKFRFMVVSRVNCQ